MSNAQVPVVSFGIKAQFQRIAWRAHCVILSCLQVKSYSSFQGHLQMCPVDSLANFLAVWQNKLALLQRGLNVCNLNPLTCNVNAESDAEACLELCWQTHVDVLNHRHLYQLHLPPGCSVSPDKTTIAIFSFPSPLQNRAEKARSGFNDEEASVRPAMTGQL